MASDTKTQGLVKLGQNESLDSWIEYVYGDLKCKCEYQRVGMGSLRGINMGKGWGRITTHPDCPHHGPCPKDCKADHYHRDWTAKERRRRGAQSNQPEGR